MLYKISELCRTQVKGLSAVTNAAIYDSAWHLPGISVTCSENESWRMDDVWIVRNRKGKCFFAITQRVNELKEHQKQLSQIFQIGHDYGLKNKRLGITFISDDYPDLSASITHGYFQPIEFNNIELSHSSYREDQDQPVKFFVFFHHPQYSEAMTNNTLFFQHIENNYKGALTNFPLL